MVVGSPDLYRSFSQYYVQGNGVHEIRLCVNINESHVNKPACGLFPDDAVVHLQPPELGRICVPSQRGMASRQNIRFCLNISRVPDVAMLENDLRT